jgi:NAD(P)-dependent dehydrogenase (short-subunit alcohol dehydrogenase family)
MLKRKHHCRACGTIVCGGCSRKSALSLKLGYYKAVRVCDGCAKDSKLFSFSAAVPALPAHGFGEKTTALEVVESLRTEAAREAESSGRPTAATCTEDLHFVMTGASSGIGKHVAAALLQLGPHVHLHVGVRRLVEDDREGPVQQGILDAAPNGSLSSSQVGSQVHLYECDLASFASVRGFASALLEQETPIAGIVLGAGIMGINVHTLTDDGHEMHFQVNYLSHVLLTLLLEPALRRAAEDERLPVPRVVAISSEAHRMVPVDITDLDSAKAYKMPLVGKWLAHGQSKAALVTFTAWLPRVARRRGYALRAFSLHPGQTDTSLHRELSKVERALGGASIGPASLWYRRPECGAATTVYALLAPSLDTLGDEADANSGFYLRDCSVTPAADHCMDAIVARLLWNSTTRDVGLGREFGTGRDEETEPTGLRVGRGGAGGRDGSDEDEDEEDLDLAPDVDDLQ